MVGLILLVLLPSLGLSAVLVVLSAQHEQDVMASTVRQRADLTASAIDLLLSAVRARLFAVAGAGISSSGGLAQLYQRASQAFDHPHLMLVLTDPSGQKIFNTTAPYGDSLPTDADQSAVQRVVRTGMPFISDLAISGVTGQPVVTVNVPVMQAGRVTYVLSANVLPLLRGLIARLDLPTDWLCMISDREGYTIARTRAGDRFVGQVSHPGFLKRVRATEEGWFSGVSRDGVPSYVGFSHAQLAGWVVAFAIPANTLLEPIRHSTRMLVLAGLCILSIALLAAIIIARRISQPIMRLVEEAQAVGRGAPAGLVPTGLRETDAVAHSLYQSSDRLLRHAAERDEAMSSLRDSEQRFRALAKELAHANTERLHLLRGTVQAQEAERARVARELHDSLGQYVTALRLGLKAIETHCSPEPKAREQLMAMSTLTGEVGRELNRLAWELRPTALDDLGLETAIRQLVDDWAERSGLQFDLHMVLGGKRLPQDVETTLYRVLQEAITNAVKHAEGERVAVVLEASPSEVRLIVEDDGKGMPEGHAAARRGKRLGMVGMRERLALVKGDLQVESTPGNGTTLFARIPL